MTDVLLVNPRETSGFFERMPPLDYAELEDIDLRMYRKRFGGWAGIKRGVRKVADLEKPKKLVRLARVQLRKTIQGAR
jgi:hypothetical protein